MNLILHAMNTELQLFYNQELDRQIGEGLEFASDSYSVDCMAHICAMQSI